MDPSVVSVSMSPAHSFSKPCVPAIELVAGLGVRGDAHAGATVKHRSRVARDASAPNLRQVHLGIVLVRPPARWCAKRA